MPTIRHKRSATGSDIPTTGELVTGELAINVRDARIFTLKDVGGALSVVLVGAEMSATLADALRETSGTAFLAALGLSIPTVHAPVILAAQATTSGTVFDVESIPSWASQIDIMFDRVTLSGTDSILVQIGDSGGIENTGYAAASAGSESTAGFPIHVGYSNNGFTGTMRLRRGSADGTRWFADHSGVSAVTTDMSSSDQIAGGGVKTLSAALDRLRVTRSGTNTFDGGGFVVAYRS